MTVLVMVKQIEKMINKKYLEYIGAPGGAAIAVEHTYNDEQGTNNPLHFKNNKNMTVEEYQEIIHKTAIYPKEIGLAYCAMGLTGEAGEVADKVKKIYRDGTDIDQKAIGKELGDVLWYITAMANELGLSLQDIMQANYEKLIKRRETNTLSGSGDDREVQAGVIVKERDYELFELLSEKYRYLTTYSYDDKGIFWSYSSKSPIFYLEEEPVYLNISYKALEDSHAVLFGVDINGVPHSDLIYMHLQKGPLDKDLMRAILDSMLITVSSISSKNPTSVDYTLVGL